MIRVRSRASFLFSAAYSSVTYARMRCFLLYDDEERVFGISGNAEIHNPNTLIGIIILPRVIEVFEEDKVINLNLIIYI